MKLNLLIQIIISILVLVIIILIFVLCLHQMEERIIKDCGEQDFKGMIIYLEFDVNCSLIIPPNISNEKL